MDSITGILYLDENFNVKSALVAATIVASLVLALQRIAFAGLPGRNAPPHIPHTIPYLGHAVSFGTSPIEFLVAAHQKYGPVFSFTMVGKTFTYLTGSDSSAPFFNSKNEDLNAEDVYAKLVTPVFGKGVAYDVPTNIFLEQKKMLKTGLNIARFRTHVPIIEQETRDYFERWGQSGEKDLFRALSELIILTASSCLHGEEIRSIMNEEVASLYWDLDGGFSHEAWLLPSWLPLPSFRKRDDAHLKIKQLFYDAIDRRRRAETKPDDMLQTLLESTYKSGRPLSDDEIAGMLIGLLMAGQHTSSTTSAWLGFYLAEHKKVQEELFKETQEAIAIGGVSYDTLKDCQLLERCIKETLRLRPPIMTMMRMCRTPLKVGDHVIPQGHQVCVSPTTNQRLPGVWEQWDKFMPERFLSKGGAVSEEKFSYIPFGAGRHRCIGESFAYVQIKTIWATLLDMFEFELATSGFPPINYQTMIHTPNNPLIRYKRRNQAS